MKTDVVPAERDRTLTSPETVLFQKHEREVLSVVERGRQTEPSRTENKWKKKQEEEERVHKAMMASMSEGWSLLLRLLQRRQEVLMLASDFYRRALEVSRTFLDGLSLRLPVCLSLSV